MSVERLADTALHSLFIYRCVAMRCHGGGRESSEPGEMDSRIERLLSGMPRWTSGTLDGKPVKVRMTQKLIFNADGASAAEFNHKHKHGERRLGPARGRRMVYVLDGREVSRYAIESLDMRTIDTFEYLRPRYARRRFGSRAADGAIIVTTSANID